MIEQEKQIISDNSFNEKLKVEETFFGFSKYQIATSIAVLFHVIGFVGIYFFKNDTIIKSTPVNLLLMLALIIWTQQEKNYYFYVFILVCFITGMVVEMIGVNTKLLFGDYSYGNVLGIKNKNVPLIIGINWFVIIYCVGISITTLMQKAIDKLAQQTAKPPINLKAISVIIDGATLAVFFDWIMEPVAVQLGYWKWNDEIPFYNYLCWFAVSLALLAAFHYLKFNKKNKFAIHLLMIQALFFLLLRNLL